MIEQYIIGNFKAKSNPITDLEKTWGFQEVEAPRFQDYRHMKVVRLSALRTGRVGHIFFNLCLEGGGSSA
jgi:hypothetical protein